MRRKPGRKELIYRIRCLARLPKPEPPTKELARIELQHLVLFMEQTEEIIKGIKGASTCPPQARPA